MRTAVRKKLEPNVVAFLNLAAEQFGRIAAEKFSQDVFCECLEQLESPIEDLFLIACKVLCEANYIEYSPDPWTDKNGEDRAGYGLHVSPQRKIGKYRVDFLLTNVQSRKEEYSVIVELDGHDFHDKDKAQRAYEKARDRYFVSSGYKVLHFTGSEVVANPWKVAHEAMLCIRALDYEFDENSPFGEF